jgi:Proteasome stabiliser
VELAQRFFHALATEPAGMRVIVQEAINRLAEAYRVAPPAERQRIMAMLSHQRMHVSEGVRMCVVVWACSVFDQKGVGVSYRCLGVCCRQDAEVPRKGVRAYILRRPPPLQKQNGGMFNRHACACNTALQCQEAKPIIRQSPYECCR